MFYVFDKFYAWLMAKTVFEIFVHYTFTPWVN